MNSLKEGMQIESCDPLKKGRRGVVKKVGPIFAHVAWGNSQKVNAVRIDRIHVAGSQQTSGYRVASEKD